MNDDMKTVDQMIKEQRAQAYKIMFLTGFIRVAQYIILGMGMGLGFVLGRALGNLAL